MPPVEISSLIGLSLIFFFIISVDLFEIHLSLFEEKDSW